MHRYLSLCLILFSMALTLHGQKSEGGKPYSILLPGLKSTSGIPQIQLKELDVSVLTQEIINYPAPVRYGVFTDTLINVKMAGKKDEILPAGNIWRLRISNHSAKSIQIRFKKFILPRGAQLFVYNDNQEILYGAFTKRNIQQDSAFTIADFKGDHINVEYFEPLHPEFSGQVIIGAIGQAFTDIMQTESGPDGFININCPIGKDAQLAKHSVCKMSFRSGDYQVTCSGALINNLKNDGIPYFLTANHCLTTQAEAASLTLYFNYETVGCGDGELLPTQLYTAGSVLLSTGASSDFTLLQLNDIPPPEFQPYYAGWDARDAAAFNVFGVHVPFNQTKKVSLDYDTIYSNPIEVIWDDNSQSPVGSHWVIGFDEGGTSQGSSGSPLFNSNNQIIGQLHGGDDVMAFYGKFSYSYALKPSKFNTIAHFLDPDSTGVLTVDGYSPVNNTPDAFIVTKMDQVCHDHPVLFEDYSVFGPYKREWSVSPLTFTFMDGTSDTSAHPVIQFSQDTIYTVTLNLKINDEIVSTENMIIASASELAISVESDLSDQICDCDFKDIKLTALGADSYIWSILPGYENIVYFTSHSGDTTTLSRVPAYMPDGNYIFGISVTGKQGTCEGIFERLYDALKPVNDEIENAVLLEYGNSEYYTNTCASIQESEPIPPFQSCTSQTSWCDEYGTGEDIVENSVWFKFIAGPTGRISISSNGMDNQIALYSADSYTDILEGNYNIVAANDDRTEANYRPLIISAQIEPERTYWIQVDGSGGGVEGDFYLTLTSLSALSAGDPISQSVLVYPQPAKDRIFIENSKWTASDAKVMIYSASGVCILNEQKLIDTGRITLDVDTWEPGIYFALIQAENLRYIARIVKK